MQPSPYSPAWSIRALVLYDKWLYDSAHCPGWYFAFRGYNGGIGLLNKDISKAGNCGIIAIEKACKRRVIKLKSGALLDMCQVNVTYPYKIAKAGEKYERRK
jgi:hypothetical protein